MSGFISRERAALQAQAAKKLRKREKLICGAFLCGIVFLTRLIAVPIGITIFSLIVSFAIGYFFLALYVSREKRDNKRALLGGGLATFFCFFLSFKIFDVVNALDRWDLNYLFYSLLPTSYVLILGPIFTLFVCLGFLRLDRYFWEYRQEHNPSDILIVT